MKLDVSFNIPEDIAEGLDNGELERHGGVVRDQKGQIVTHLEETVINNSSNPGRDLLVGAAGALGLAVIGGAVYSGKKLYEYLKNKRKSSEDMPDNVIKFEKKKGPKIKKEKIV